MPVNVNISAFNEYKLRLIEKSILKIFPTVTPKGLNIKQFGIYATLMLSEGCQLFLTNNINCKVNIFSGFKCYFVAPFYNRITKSKVLAEDELEERDIFPDCLLVRFEDELKCCTLPNNVLPMFPKIDIYFDPSTARKVR